ncbi:MAG TPA: hypothetical protein VHU18_03470 [Rhizomicrobium sp.]|jgi:hypothetical protein|nr:hypothetical protein [Rhizomicrobium sp.]
MTGKIDMEQLCELLMREYELVRKEIATSVKNYKAHVKYVQIVVTAIFVGVPFLSSPALRSVGPTLGVPVDWFFLILFVGLPTAIFYLLWDVLESQYSLITLAGRAAQIEGFLNKAAPEKNVFTWESGMAPVIWSSGGITKGTNPSIYLTFYISVLALLGSVILPVAGVLAIIRRGADRVLTFVCVVVIVYLIVSACTALAVGYFILSRLRSKVVHLVATANP